MWFVSPPLQKDAGNPIALVNAGGDPITRGYAGPSNLWRSADGAVQMLIQLDGA